MAKDKKRKTWASLKEEKCPKCGTVLSNDMFGGKTMGCVCGFVVTRATKDLLVERDNK